MRLHTRKRCKKRRLKRYVLLVLTMVFMGVTDPPSNWHDRSKIVPTETPEEKHIKHSEMEWLLMQNEMRERFQRPKKEKKEEKKKKKKKKNINTII